MAMKSRYFKLQSRFRYDLIFHRYYFRYYTIHSILSNYRTITPQQKCNAWKYKIYIKISKIF